MKKLSPLPAELSSRRVCRVFRGFPRKQGKRGIPKSSGGILRSLTAVDSRLLSSTDFRIFSAAVSHAGFPAEFSGFSPEIFPDYFSGFFGENFGNHRLEPSNSSDATKRASNGISPIPSLRILRLPYSSVPLMTYVILDVVYRCSDAGVTPLRFRKSCRARRDDTPIIPLPLGERTNVLLDGVYAAYSFPAMFRRDIGAGAILILVPRPRGGNGKGKGGTALAAPPFRSQNESNEMK